MSSALLVRVAFLRLLASARPDGGGSDEDGADDDDDYDDGDVGDGDDDDVHTKTSNLYAKVGSWPYKMGHLSQQSSPRPSRRPLRQLYRDGRQDACRYGPLDGVLLRRTVTFGVSIVQLPFVRYDMRSDLNTGLNTDH